RTVDGARSGPQPGLKARRPVAVLRPPRASPRRVKEGTVRAIRADRRQLRLLGWCVCGLALGAAAGVCAVATAVASGRSTSADRDPASLIDVGHLPPLLRVPGEK